MTVTLTAMSVSARKFLREFPVFREQAERGETVVIESREGVKFVFYRIGEAPRPRQVEAPLPREITETWDVESPALKEEDLEINR